MQNKILKNAGLSDVQAEIYAFLLENGENKASSIAKSTKRPRGVVYKGLDDLLLLELIEKIENKGITRFKADHPGNLEKVMDLKGKQIEQEINNKKARLEIDKKSLTSSMSNLISIFNLNNAKPGILHYEGKEGIKNALAHIMKNFRSDREIISFVKVLPEKYTTDINKAFSSFIQARINSSIHTRVLAIDSSEARDLRKNDPKSLRKTKLVSNEKIPLDFQGGELFIYRNEICVTTMENNIHFAFIVQNKSIAQLLRAFFESNWLSAGNDLTATT